MNPENISINSDRTKRLIFSTVNLKYTVVLAVMWMSGLVNAEVKMPAIFGDHMVLQQGMTLPIWGTAGKGERVVVSVAGKTGTAVADDNGKWMVKLEPLAVTATPLEMEVSGSNKLVFKDVLVGEVWVCSGQSNMVVGGRTQISKEVGSRRQIRFFKVPNTANIQLQADLPGNWVVCTEEANSLYLSATGYYFAVNIEQARKAPVGMIQSAWGGSGIEPWIDLDAFEKSERFKKVAGQVLAQRQRLPQLTERYEKETLPAWQEKHRRWEEQKNAVQPVTAPDAKGIKAPPEPARPKPPDQQEKLPSVMFNAMVSPIIPLAITGVLWYQGESNSQNEARSREYGELLPLLISGWRAKWGQGDFPFLYVQLPAFTTDRAWPELRQSQLEALSLPKTGMAVALDLNPTDNLHPPNKEAVGQRLALLARKIAYGENIVSSGPLFRSMKIEGNKIRLTFTETGSGLALGGPPPAYRRAGQDPSLEKSLLGFEIAGTADAFMPARAEIDGDTVVVWSDELPQPTKARYAWANYPQANLYNKEGLPASPFRTDNAQ